MTEARHIKAGEVVDGKYRIVRLLGEGGMGAVYEGENLRIRRRVAIKMLHPDVSTQTDVVKRFEREAQAAALVGSEHICDVFDLGVLGDDTRYMVMEYLDGETLSGRIAHHGRLTPVQSIPLMLQVLDALGAAHAAGIIHRDLKPDNIFILPQRGGIRDFVKILDFGVSKFAQLSADEMNVTRVGAVVGTPYYMSPEQARGISAVDARTDIYAIGVLLYQATTGEVPYQAETFNELLFKIALDVPPPPQTYVPDLDAEFAGIILKAMSRDPAQRFQSCAEFRQVLLNYQAARASFPNRPPQQSWNAVPNPSSPQLFNLTPIPHSAPGYPPAPQPPTGSNWSSPPGPTGPNVTPSGSGTVALSDPMNHTATSKAWGHASGSTTIPKSKAPVVIGIIAAVIVGGGAAFAAFLFLTNPSGDKTTAHGGGAATAQATAAETTAGTTAGTTPPPIVSTAPSSIDAAVSATPTAVTPADTATAAVPAIGGVKPGKTGRPYTGRPGPLTGPTAKPSSGKTPPKPGSDLGY
jgi:eukaryotic-like serine/threonine-protein kinase